MREQIKGRLMRGKIKGRLVRHNKAKLAILVLKNDLGMAFNCGSVASRFQVATSNTSKLVPYISFTLTSC